MQYDNINVFAISSLEANEMIGKIISVKYIEEEFQEIDILEEEILKEFQGKFIKFELFSDHDSVCSLTLSMNPEFWKPPLKLSINQIKNVCIV